MRRAPLAFDPGGDRAAVMRGADRYRVAGLYRHRGLKRCHGQAGKEDRARFGTGLDRGFGVELELDPARDAVGLACDRRAAGEGAAVRGRKAVLREIEAEQLDLFRHRIHTGRADRSQDAGRHEIRHGRQVEPAG